MKWSTVGKIAAALITVANVAVGTVLVTAVDGYAIGPEVRFWIPVFQAASATALFFLPRPTEPQRGDGSWAAAPLPPRSGGDSRGVFRNP